MSDMNETTEILAYTYYHPSEIAQLGTEDIPDRYGWIQFQHGTIPEVGVNGTTNEQVIEMLIARLTELNSRFPCSENRQAMAALQEALNWLNERTRRRQRQGIEGQHREQEA